MHWALATVLLLAPGSVRAIIRPKFDYPIDVEIDIIFPRPGGTYKKVYPFPVVYGIRNAGALWPFEFFFNIGLSGKGFLESLYLPPPDGVSQNLFSTGELSDDEDPFYAILAVEDVVNATEVDTVYAHWSFAIPGDCMDFPPQERGFIKEQYTAYGNFSFTLSDDGDLPDITAGNECPEPLYAVRVLSLSDRVLCVAEAEPAEPDPCLLKIPEELKTKVAEKMVKEAGCKNGTQWPDEKLKGKCPPWKDDSAASSVSGDLAGIFVAVMVSVLFLTL